MPRLFTALEVPAATALALSLLQGGLSGARWIPRESLHVTLRFIGDVDGRTGEAVADALADSVAPAVAVTVTGLGSFGGSPPRSLHAAVDGGDALLGLARSHERLLRRLGLPPEKRTVHPHVTLARLRGVGDGEAAAWLDGRDARGVPGFVADRFVLLSSRDSRGGGPYAVEAAYPLG